MAEYVIQATADPNTASPTVTVNLDEPPGFVMDSQVIGGGMLVGDVTPSELTATFYVRGENLPTEVGLYDVEILVTPIAPYLNATILLRRNGLTLWPATLWVADPPGWFRLTGPYETSNRGGGGPFTVPVIGGDEYEVIVVNNAGLQVHAVRFTFISDEGSVGEPLPLLGAPEPVGNPGETTWQDAYLNTDPTYAARSHDMVVLNDGTLLVAFYEDKDLGVDPGGSGDHIFGQSMVLKRWDPGDGSWHVVTYDLWGRGYQATLVLGGVPMIAMVTDGSDAWIAFGQPDGTFVPLGANWNWRVIRYHGATATLSEVGSSGGRRAIVPRTTVAANAGFETSGLDVKLDPAGRPWVSWHERLDVDPPNRSPEMRPHVWRWDGSAWQDTGLVGPQGFHTDDGWTSAYIDVGPTRRVALGFLPGSDHAVAIYGVHHWGADVDGTGIVDDFVLQEWDGSAWHGVAQPVPGDIWPELRGVAFPPVGPSGARYVGSWYQGADLQPVGDELWAILALGYASRIDSGVIGAYGGGTLEPPLLGAVYDHPGGGRYNTGGWRSPSTGELALDGEGWVYMTLTTAEAAGRLGEPDSWFGDLLLLKAESGLSDGWTAASKHALPFYFTASETPAALAFHGTTCYMALSLFDESLPVGVNRTQLVVVRRERDGEYVPWSQEVEPFGINISFTDSPHTVPVWTRVDDPRGM